VHAVGSITYSSLSGIPSTFAPAAHTQAISTVTGLQDALDAKQVTGTYATLVGGTVPSAQLPSYVDDVIEYANLAGFPGTGETGKIYVARDTGKIYRWSGSAYVEISPSPGSTDSVTEGATNLYFTNARAVAAIPTATSSVAGLVKVGSGLTITSGVLAATGGGDDARWGYFKPAAPTSVTASAGNGQASVSWTAPSVLAQTPVTDYVVQYSNNSGSTWATFSDGTSTSTSATVTGLTNGTAYTFRVAAVNGIGQGAWSTASSAATPSAFSASAVILTSGTSYTVPSGASTMKVWAVGPGGQSGSGLGHAGAVAYKTWSVSGGSSVAFSLGNRPVYNGNSYRSGSTTVTYGGVTITAEGGSGTNVSDGGAATYSGGDGGANGGLGGYPPEGGASGGAVGGNGAVVTPCNRYSATDVSGLFAAVTMAGGTVTETCADAAAFGSGGAANSDKRPGIGGGGAWSGTGFSDLGGVGAVVIQFT